MGNFVATGNNGYAAAARAMPDYGRISKQCVAWFTANLWRKFAQAMAALRQKKGPDAMPGLSFVSVYWQAYFGMSPVMPST